MSRQHLPRAVTSLVVACFIFSAFPATSVAQWPPERLENIQVFPEDIEVRQLIGIMRGFTGALGVRCTYCHVGEEDQPISTYDFPSDEKVTKEKARVMVRMLQHINGEHLAELPVDSADRLVVQCATCHRGQPRPLTLAQAITAVLDEQGADSAIAFYHGLRDRFYGRATYDFGEFSLNGLGYALLRSGRAEDAVRIFQLNVEVYPDRANGYDSLGDGHKAAGQAQAALRSYLAAFELDPEMRGLQERIDSLRVEP